MMKDVKFSICLIFVTYLYLSFPSLIFAANIKFSKPSTKFLIGTPVTIPISITGDEASLGTDLVLKFDPKMISEVSIKNGNLYPTYNPADKKRVDIQRGIINISGSASLGKTVKANGIFAQLTFTPISTGVTSIDFDYKKGSTTGTGIIDSSGKDLISSQPTSLDINIREMSIIEKFSHYFSKLFSKK